MSIATPPEFCRGIVIGQRLHFTVASVCVCETCISDKLAKECNAIQQRDHTCPSLIQVHLVTMETTPSSATNSFLFSQHAQIFAHAFCIIPVNYHFLLSSLYQEKILLFQMQFLRRFLSLFYIRDFFLTTVRSISTSGLM